MSWQLLGLALFLGWLAGGLVNWAADSLPGWRTLPRAQRLPAHWRDLLHCWTLPWYWSRRGCCPHCGQARTWRAPTAELGVMALFVFAAWLLQGRMERVAVAWVYTWLLAVVVVVDLEHRRVLNVLLVPAALLAIGFSFLPTPPSPLAMIIGGLVGFGLFFLLGIIGRGALGFGDVKLAGVIGLMVGFPYVLVALMGGALLGGVAALMLLLTHRATRKSTIAYAPYLAMGALGTVLWLLR